MLFRLGRLPCRLQTPTQSDANLSHVGGQRNGAAQQAFSLGDLSQIQSEARAFRQGGDLVGVIGKYPVEEVPGLVDFADAAENRGQAEANLWVGRGPLVQSPKVLERQPRGVLSNGLRELISGLEMIR